MTRRMQRVDFPLNDFAMVSSTSCFWLSDLGKWKVHRFRVSDIPGHTFVGPVSNHVARLQRDRQRGDLLRRD
jgi:hypothetical protein